MKEIKLLMEHIEDELRDAHTYAELALEYRTTDPETAELFYKLSGEEMNHMNALHKAVVAHIEDYRKKKGERSITGSLQEVKRDTPCQNHGKACLLVWTNTIPTTVMVFGFASNGGPFGPVSELSASTNDVETRYVFAGTADKL